MKFFSNDAKENSDEPYDRDRDHGDVVTSDPVAVPQQRAGSPWSDAPADTRADDTRTDEEIDDTRADDTRTDDRIDDTRADDTRTDDRIDDTRADEEAGSPDDELAEQERRDGTDEEPASRRDDLDEHDETDTVTTYHPDGTVETEDRSDSAVVGDESDKADSSDEPESDPALRRDAEDEPESDPALRRDVADEPAEDEAVKDEGTFDSPQAVEPATGEPLAASTDESDKSDESDDPALRRDVAEAPAADVTPVAAADADSDAEAVPSTPGSVPAPALDRLFSDGDSFAERFREIQLRFVDTPKEATADAAALVGEAVDKLTSALQAQKDALGGDSDDTEQLRVQLRSYRDLLNRLSAL